MIHPETNGDYYIVESMFVCCDERFVEMPSSKGPTLVHRPQGLRVVRYNELTPLPLVEPLSLFVTRPFHQTIDPVWSMSVFEKHHIPKHSENNK